MTSGTEKSHLIKRQGFPIPYGVTFYEREANFSLFSTHATEVVLCLFDGKDYSLQNEIVLDPDLNKTGDIWHISIEGLGDEVIYAYRVTSSSSVYPHHRFNDTNYLVDPYAKSLTSSRVWGEGVQNPLGVAGRKKTRINDNDKQLHLPLKDLVIYEMHVRGFTRDESSKVEHKGKFLGLIEKIPHLVELGVNAVELLPIHEFNETDNPRKNPITGEKLCNYWGYSPLSYFAIMNRYVSGEGWDDSIKEFKTLVRELHRHGIEVILDVVFNHTGEGDRDHMTYSYKGIDNSVYYMLASDGHYLNYTGCGNTLNCNHPVVQEMIINSLRYFVTEMHVDGFRFDLASIMARGMSGDPMSLPPLVQSISYDPVLSKTKLIAEPWDCAGLYQVGEFYYGKDCWSEWNGRYRDVVRRFIKGSFGDKREFATKICGSEDLYYYNRSPLSSINFITAHDGFTLADLTSYDHKHNEINGEMNRDGANFNDSWNCGMEGETDDPAILNLRERQMKNFHLALMISQGVPMIHMGDEYGHTKRGNNNTWCQDNKLNWFLWDKLKEKNSFFRFYKEVIKFRKNHEVLKSVKFLRNGDIEWYGPGAQPMDWNDLTQFIAFSLFDRENRYALYVVFNGKNHHMTITIPPPPEGTQWHWIVNTSAPAPGDFYTEEDTPLMVEESYTMLPLSSLLLKSLKKI